jgi:predicted transcriptional regulator
MATVMAIAGEDIKMGDYITGGTDGKVYKYTGGCSVLFVAGADAMKGDKIKVTVPDHQIVEIVATDKLE